MKQALQIQVADAKGKKRDVTDADIATKLDNETKAKNAWWKKTSKGYQVKT